MRQNLLLLVDVDELGRSGEIVSVKPGYARNYLLPQKKAVVAGEQTLRIQKRLQEERAKRAVLDKKEAEELSKVIEKITLETRVKVDPEGKMYGSVSPQDIISLLEKHAIKLDKKNVVSKHPIKETGSFTISFKLKEGVLATCKLEIIPEGRKIESKAPAKEKKTLKAKKEPKAKKEEKKKEPEAKKEEKKEEKS